MTEKDLRELSSLCEETAGEAYFYGLTSTYDLMDKAATVFDLLADKVKEKNVAKMRQAVEKFKNK